MESDDKLLFSMKYNPLKVLLRFALNSLVIIAFTVGILDLLEVEKDLKEWAKLIFLISFTLVTILMTIEHFIHKEIRFYERHLEKEWYFFKPKSMLYSNIRVTGISVMWISSKNFMNIKKPSFFQWKCCGYIENMLYSNDIKEVEKVLAYISGRDVEEFSKSKINMNPFVIKNQLGDKS